MKSFLSILFLILGHISCVQSQSTQVTQTDSTNFDKIYPFALRGNMDQVFDMLSKAEESGLNQEQLKRKKDYYERFVYRNEDFDYRSDSDEIVDLYKRFQNYWRSVIIENVSQQLADSLFRLETNHFLKKHFKPGLKIEPSARTATPQCHCCGA